MVGRGVHELGFQVTQLEYKLGWNGGRLIAVPAIRTSRTCPECGYEAHADLWQQSM